MFNQKEYNKIYSKKNAEKARMRAHEWYINNHERALIYCKQRRSNIGYREGMKVYLRKYYLENRNEILDKNKLYRNKPDYLEKKSKNHNRNMIENPNYALSHIIRGRINSALKFNYSVKVHKTIKLLGCSIKEARKYIESKFKDGMSWSNHGKKTWHIDHIKPLASFDLTNPKEQKKAFHYTNLQPLFWRENLSKGKR